MVQDLSNRFPQHKYYKVYPDALSVLGRVADSNQALSE